MVSCTSYLDQEYKKRIVWKGINSMIITEKLKQVKSLVGDITEEDLKFVDCYVSKNLGIFIPSVGFCGYAIQEGHIHPSYSFAISFSKESMVFPSNVNEEKDMYHCTAISPEVPHEEEKKDSFTRYIALFISEEYYEDIYYEYTGELPKTYDLKNFLVTGEIIMYVKAFIKEIESNIKFNHIILDSLSAIITNMLVRNIIGLNEENDVEYFTDQYEVEKVLAYIQQYYGQKILTSDLASIVGMSGSNFNRTFKKTLGITPMEYLIKIRIEKSKKLLKSDISITEISLSCGFSSTSHFSTSFSKHNGMTPSEYRESYI